MADPTRIRSSARRVWSRRVWSRRVSPLGTCLLSAWLLPATLALGACERPALKWTDAAPLSTTQPSPLAQPPVAAIDTVLADSAAMSRFLHMQDLLREAGAQELVTSHLDSTPAAREPLPSGAMAMGMTEMPPAPLSSLGDGEVPLDSARCTRSLRSVAAAGRGRVALWWSKRDRGRVMLLAAWRDGDAGGWRGPIVVDSLDQGPGDAQAAERGAVGCVRAAPSVAIDDKHGYVHVAYVLVGPEGPGVFYAHQMDPRAQFEPPKAILYGTKLGAVRVAAAGDVVAVAYEDPNSGSRPRVGVAVSTTSGHVFVEQLTASTDNSNARDPWVAVRGRAVVVGWSDIPATGGDTTFRIRRARIER